MTQFIEDFVPVVKYNGLNTAKSMDLTSATPKISALYDTNGNEVLKVSATASAVNEITITNAAASGFPQIAPSGDDTSIYMYLSGKGVGYPLFASTSTGTASSGAVTVNHQLSVITTESYSGGSAIATGGSATITLTNNKAASFSRPFVSVARASATAGTLVANAKNNGNGTITITLTNAATASTDGTFTVYVLLF